MEAAGDDYRAIMIKALADRMAEAFAEYLHARVRREWGYGAAEQLSNEQIIEEEYRGIRPAFGYPSCPDHLPKGDLWKLMDVEKRIGMKLTESFACGPPHLSADSISASLNLVTSASIESLENKSKTTLVA